MRSSEFGTFSNCNTLYIINVLQQKKRQMKIICRFSIIRAIFYAFLTQISVGMPSIISISLRSGEVMAGTRLRLAVRVSEQI